MAQRIEAWKSQDGEIFLSEEKAKQHECYLYWLEYAENILSLDRDQSIDMWKKRFKIIDLLNVK